MATVERTWILVAAVAAGVLFAGLLAAMAITGDGRVALVAVVLWVGGYLLVSRFGKASRRRAVEAEARRLGLSFSRRDPFRVLDSDFHPFVRFGKLPGSQGVENVVWGERAGREVRAFEYWRPVAEDEPIRYSCSMVRIPGGWPPLLVRRKGRLDVARSAAGLGGQEFELENFNRAFEVRSDDRRLASAVVDQRMMGWLLESDPVLGFQLQHGWLLSWMPRLPPQELERVLTMVEGFHERIQRAVWSLYGDGPPVGPGS